MKKISILSVLLIPCISLSAQNFKIPLGKKMQAIANSNMTMIMNAMGQEITVETDNDTNGEYEFKTAGPDGYTMTSIIKNLKTKTTTLGTEIAIDSDNEADRNNPAYTEAFKLFNAPTEITVKDNKATITGAAKDQAYGMGGGLIDNMIDVTRFVLPGKYLSKLSLGNQWTDSTTNNETSMINEFTVEKNEANIIVLLVKTTFTIGTTIKQMGMEAKALLKGTMNAHRFYDKVSGVLGKEDSFGEITGNIEIMEQSMPITMKIKSTTVIN